jgi:hypothetical protein
MPYREANLRLSVPEGAKVGFVEWRQNRRGNAAIPDELRSLLPKWP